MKHLSAILALTILIFASLACSGGGETTNGENRTPATKTEATPAGNTTTEKDSADGVTIEWIKLYTDDGSGGEGDEVTGFKPTDNPQHFTARMSEFEGGIKIKLILTAVDAGGEKNFKIIEREVETNSITNQAVFSAKLPRPFPVGDYRADCYVNGKLSKSVNYKVQ